MLVTLPNGGCQFLVRGLAIYGLEAAFLGNWAEIGHFAEDLQCSEAIMPGKWRRRNLVQQLKENIAQLFRAEM